jgi:osomolarity two-component system response regulator SKN7
MNDVLPKPFTKEGLLSMLEKHLGHLKKHPAQPLEMNPVHASAPTKRSYKSDDSPATSPATVSNWNSPGPVGVSPASGPAEDSYLHPAHNNAGPGHAPYVMPPQAGMPPPSVQAPMYAGASLPAGGLGPRPMIQQHRRGISDISGGLPDMGDAKRQQLYGGVAPSPHMQHLTSTNGMPHLMHPQPGHGMPRPR